MKKAKKQIKHVLYSSVCDELFIVIDAETNKSKYGDEVKISVVDKDGNGTLFFTYDKIIYLGPL